MSIEKMKSAKTTVFDIETLVIVDRVMNDRKLNFSQAVCFCIKNGDYLLKKLLLSRQAEQLKEVVKDGN